MNTRTRQRLGALASNVAPAAISAVDDTSDAAVAGTETSEAASAENPDATADAGC